MPRIAGVDLPKEKKVGVSLSTLYGIGRSNARKILQQAGISLDVRAKNLTEEEVSRLATIIQKDYRVEGALRREVSSNIKRLMDIGSYRGLRHKRGLPVRGQRTRTNARTRKGPKKTIGAQRKKETPATGASAGRPASPAGRPAAARPKAAEPIKK